MSKCVFSCRCIRLSGRRRKRQATTSNEVDVQTESVFNESEPVTANTFKDDLVNVLVTDQALNSIPEIASVDAASIAAVGKYIMVVVVVVVSIEIPYLMIRLKLKS